GDAFQVNAAGAGNQGGARGVALAGGGFAVRWGSDSGGDADIFMRMFDAEGTPITGDLLVNTEVAGSQLIREAAPLSGGGFILTWLTPGAGGLYNVEARIFDSDGEPIGGQFRVAASVVGSGWQVTVAPQPDGG